MADVTVTLNQFDPKPIRAFDNGDGTFSLAMRAKAWNILEDHTINAALVAAALIGTPTPAPSGVLVQNDPSNATGNDVYVGSATSQSMRLQPGQSEQVPMTDASQVYIKAIAGTPRVNWHICHD